ncbi:helix-turn-helix domain-containing protein [Marinobacterium sp. BA1]|uniref:helix-turn-helix domain-containing protein n=1 Tax=Marinobacterium sp. BA1 TaxID=3138931 RepID=UPI0032E6832D
MSVGSRHANSADFSEREDTFIRERAQADLGATLARGRAGGRKPKLGDKQMREIKALLRDPAIEVAEVARRYGVSRTTLYKHVGVVVPRQ